MNDTHTVGGNSCIKMWLKPSYLSILAQPVANA
jgi:hypothetical protein